MPQQQNTESDDEEAELLREAQLLARHKEYFAAIETQNIEALEKILSDTEMPVSINCEDALSLTGLANAIKQRSLKMMKFMIENKAEIGDSLLIAVEYQFFEGIKILIEHLHCDPNVAVVSKHFLFGTTPLMVACHQNSYHLIEYLLSHKAEPLSENPNIYGQEDGLQRSLYRLSLYRALCSQSYIMLTKIDPLFHVFKLSNQCKWLASCDSELSEEYLALYEKCENFTLTYLNLINKEEDLMLLLSLGIPDADTPIKPGRHKFSRLVYAIENDHILFVSHPFCQQAIERSFMASIPWKSLSLIPKCALILSLIIVLPCLWAVTIFLPQMAVTKRFLNFPLLRFLSTLLGYVFLAIAVTFQLINLNGWNHEITGETAKPEIAVSAYVRNSRKTPFNLLEIYIFAWIFGRAFEIVRQILFIGIKGFFKDYWNYYDMFTCILYLMACLMRIMDKPGDIDDLQSGFVPRHWFEVFFSLGGLLVLNRSLFWLSFIQRFGALNILLGSALIIVIKFFAIFVVLQFSFAAGLNALIYPENLNFILSECVPPGYTDAGARLCIDRLDSSYVKQFTSFFGALWMTFWALAGSVNFSTITNFYNGNLSLPVKFSAFIWMAYCIVGVLIFLNVLVGLMFKTLNTIGHKVVDIWKFKKSQMFMMFILGKDAIPPPLNIIPSVPNVTYIISYIRERKREVDVNLLDIKNKEKDQKQAETKAQIMKMLSAVRTKYAQTISARSSNNEATSDHLKDVSHDFRKEFDVVNGKLDNIVDFLKETQENL